MMFHGPMPPEGGYLTDEQRATMRAAAEAYAITQGWRPALVTEFGQYHVNANEQMRTSLSLTATRFRIVKEMDL